MKFDTRCLSLTVNSALHIEALPEITGLQHVTCCKCTIIYHRPNQKRFSYTHTNGRLYEIWETSEGAALQQLKEMNLVGGEIKEINQSKAHRSIDQF